MPSEAAATHVREALARAHDAFRSALSITVEQVRGTLATQRADDRLEAAELGDFAVNRIDSVRFTSLFADRRDLDVSSVERMEEAFAALSDIAGRAADLFEVNVEPGASLRASICVALADVGRAFGAARVFELARTGRFREEEHASWLRAFPFSRWNRSERAVAPPLLVAVNGRDLHAEALGVLMDGSLKLLLVARGETPLAPLVRLITPGTFVMQTDDSGALARFGEHEGPGVAALVAKPAACFVHDPGGGAELWERVVVDHMPESAPPPFLGGRSAAQQRDELAQLEAFARRPAPAVSTEAEEPAAAPAEAAADDPVDKLAAWLLTQAVPPDAD